VEERQRLGKEGVGEDSDQLERCRGLAAPYNPPVLLWPQWTFGGVGGRTAGGAEEENVSLDCVGWWAHVRVSH